MSASPARLKFTPVDVLLLFLVIIWGTNFSVVKVVVAEIPPFGFNTLRLITASVVLLLAVRVTGAPAPARSAWPRTDQRDECFAHPRLYAGGGAHP